MKESRYDVARALLGSIADVDAFRPDPIPEGLLEELVSVAGGPLPARFPEPPWRFVIVVGDEREKLVSHVSVALARHWGMGTPRGLASDKVLSAPALVVVLSTVASSEGVEALATVAGAAQSFLLLAHAAGLAAHRIDSPHLVPESVLDFVGERLGPELRRSELVALLALGFPAEKPPPPPPSVTRAHWIGRPADVANIRDPGSRMLVVQRPAVVLRAPRGERVLAVDPYPFNRDLLSAHLGSAGYDVTVFHLGEELRSAAAERPADLYILAESLPDIDGFALARRLRAGGTDRAPIVVTTGRRDSAFRIGGLSAGVDYYLRNPINPIELYTAARILLERHRLVDELRRANAELGRLIGELRAAQARLVQQAKMASLGQLVAGVAHEINTPLGAVVSNNDLFLRAFDRLRRGLLDSGLPLGEAPFERVQRDLDAVTVLGEVTRLACLRITGIVRSLRSFARLDEADVKPVNLNEGLESTLVLIAYLLKGGIAVERRYGADLPLVECHPNQINQVFMNLLVNACQAIDVAGAGRGGVITIETARLDGDRVQVAISDTGRGIPAEHLPRIFDPGFTTKGVGVGTGLGLSICYQIAEAHGGDIAVQSTWGHGARFILTLPIRQPTRPLPDGAHPGHP